MAIRKTSQFRTFPGHEPPRQRFRRMGVERVEDRCLLAAIAFQTGMDSQLCATPNNAISSAASLMILPAGGAVLNGTSGQSAPTYTNGATIPFYPWTDSDFVATPGIQFRTGGDGIARIPIGDPPPVTTQPPYTLLPNPIRSPIDIGPVLDNPPVVAQAPVLPPESVATPIAVGSGPTTTAAPLGLASKPNVEGNRGKSQLFDVAFSQPQPTDRDVPTATGVDGLMRESISKYESISKASLSVTFDGADGGTIADRTIAAASREASDPPAALTPDLSRKETGASGLPSLHQRAAVAAITSDSVSAGKSSRSMHREAGLGPADAAAQDEAVAVPFAAASNLAQAGSLAVANSKSDEKAGKLLVAERYWHADIVGLAVLAFAGQHVVRRSWYPSPDRPRPIPILRQKRL
jgi:hypothetical protein